MIFYVGWVFYISEPEYIDNYHKRPERYDYVSIPDRYASFRNDVGEVQNGIVLQSDANFFMVKVVRFSQNDFYQLNFENSSYRVVGKGTIYHKVNNYVGFNIMIITQIVIGILAFILIITTVFLLKEIF